MVYDYWQVEIRRLIAVVRKALKLQEADNCIHTVRGAGYRFAEEALNGL